MTVELTEQLNDLFDEQTPAELAQLLDTLTTQFAILCVKHPTDIPHQADETIYWATRLRDVFRPELRQSA